MPLDRSIGQRAFGADPQTYDAARPPYPEELWCLLRQRAGLRPDIDILEIGPGTGLATRGLLAHQPRRLTAVEPDPRLASYLRERHQEASLEIAVAPFEAVQLTPVGYDLVASATAFHWLEAVPALRRVSTLLRPGGCAALWWNVFGDAERPDPFHDATVDLFDQAAPLSRAGPPEHALDADLRIAEFRAAGLTAEEPVFLQWTLDLDAAGVRALYSTYSAIAALADNSRTQLLDRLSSVAANEFGGRVQRNMTTALYIASPANVSSPSCT